MQASTSSKKIFIVFIFGVNTGISFAFFLRACYNERMENNNKKTEATRFPIRFSKLIIGLCIAAIILCVVAIIISVWRITQFGIHGFTDVIKYPFLIAICVFGIALVISVWIKSEYVVCDKYLSLRYGFIFSKYPIKEITSIVQDTDLKKLSVYFGEQFIVITIQPEWFEKFVRALLAVNPDINYSFTLTNTPDNQ